MRNYGFCLGLILVLVLTFAEEVPPYMTKPPDMPIPTEMTKPPDMPKPPDMIKPPDMPIPTNMTKPPDMPKPPDMTKPPDMPISTNMPKPPDMPKPINIPIQTNMQNPPNMPNIPNPDCFMNLGEIFKQCFINQGLNVSIPEEDSNPQGMLQDTSDPDPGYLCTNRDKFKRAHLCRVNEMKCNPAAWELPELGKENAGIDVLCNQIDNFDVGCFNMYHPKVQECEKEVQGKLKAEGKLKNDTEGICISSDVKYDCFTSALSKCGMNTKQIYLEQLDEYKVPLQCESMRPGRAGRPTYFSYQSAWKDTSGDINLSIHSLVLFLGVVSSLLLV